MLDSAAPGLLHSVEEALVRAAFSRCRDNKVHTARTLGVTRNTLRTLLKRHGLLADGAATEPATDDCFVLDRAPLNTRTNADHRPRRTR